MSFNELRQRGTLDFPIEIYHVDNTHSRYEMVQHWHSEFEIIYVIQGEINVTLNNNQFTAGAGDVVFINPETIHGATPIDCVYECIDFDIGFLANICDGFVYFFEGILNNEYCVKEYISAHNSPVSEFVCSISHAMHNKSSGYKFRVVGELYRMFANIIDFHLYSNVSGVSEIASNKDTQKIKSVLSYVRNNYENPITLADMANAANMSPKYFCSYFKKMTQKSPVEYLNSYRVEKAANKLLNTNMSVTEISFACGFNDLSYFIKTFKSYKGITPAKFRKG